MFICHFSASPHLFHHEIPEITLRLEVGLKHLLPQRALDLQRRDPQEKEGSRGDPYFLKEDNIQLRLKFKN